MGPEDRRAKHDQPSGSQDEGLGSRAAGLQGRTLYLSDTVHTALLGNLLVTDRTSGLPDLFHTELETREDSLRPRTYPKVTQLPVCPEPYAYGQR